MNKFLILFKHELKMQFPLKPQKGRRLDPIGAILSVLMIILISAVFVSLLSTVVSNYVLVKIDKVADPIARAYELLNVCYLGILLALVMAGLENMRRTLTDKRYKPLLLRLPVKEETIFMSKLATLLISNYALAFLLVATVNTIFYLSVELPASFIGMSVLVWLLMPMSAFFISTVLLVPYIKLIDFIANKYTLIFVSVTSMVMGAFVLYSSFLGVVKSLLETGSIKFLFNEKFITTLQGMLDVTYPANCFAGIALSVDLLPSLAIALGIAAVAVVAVYFVSKKLFYATLYKNEQKRTTGKKQVQKIKLPPLLSLMRKEFICIFREPKNLFSYFAIAASMPVMVYCCYTLFESLILNMLGMSVTFPLAVLTVLIFSILTNTFCSTNVSRDGAAAIKVKMFPVKASTIMLAKVLLCGIVSSLSVIISVVILAATTSLSAFDAFVTALIAVAFSAAQIFVATRMDLNGAKLSSTLSEMQSASNRTIAKVVSLGLFLALSAGILSVVAYLFSGGSSIAFIQELGLKRAHAYLLPASISAVYLGAAIAYYGIGIEKSLNGLTI